MRSLWFPHHRAKDEAAVRLFCFPHAGAGASWFGSWPSQLPPEVEMCAVELPGRETRIREAPVGDVHRLADDITAAMTPYLDLPAVLFGHSLGALLAFEVARRLEHAGRSPELLVVSGSRAPQVPASEPAVHDLPEQELLQYVVRLQGCPDELVQCADLMGLLLPALRADFRASATYLPRGHAPVSCAVAVMGGSADPVVGFDSLVAWERQTTGPLEIQLFPGGHFYLSESPDPVASIHRRLAATLRRVPEATSDLDRSVAV